MDTTTLIIVAVIAVALVLAVALYLRSRRTHRLKDQFGPEYDRAVEDRGGRLKAEADLSARTKRVEKLTVRPLTAADSERYVASWTKIQSDFVDDPKSAVGEADKLLSQVMATRGYPMSDFDQRASDLSVDHPQVVENYRAAHDIAVRDGQGEAGTEDLRQAMIHYRALFDDLVAAPTEPSTAAAA